MSRLDEIAAKLRASANGAPIDPGESPDGPRAAVAAILRTSPLASHEGDDSAELFFIRRANHDGDPWSGHVAFPGGKRDPGDESLLITAMRETAEEVGIVLRAEDLVARLPDVPAFTRSKEKGYLVVTPFVFVVRGDHFDVNPNLREVATTLWVPMTTLERGEGKSTFKLDYEGKTYDMPCLYLPGSPPSIDATPTETVIGVTAPDHTHRLWGLTYRMLETLLEAMQ